MPTGLNSWPSLARQALLCSSHSLQPLAAQSYPSVCSSQAKHSTYLSWRSAEVPPIFKILRQTSLKPLESSQQSSPLPKHFSCPSVTCCGIPAGHISLLLPAVSLQMAGSTLFLPDLPPRCSINTYGTEASRSEPDPFSLACTEVLLDNSFLKNPLDDLSPMNLLLLQFLQYFNTF
jgi:hypothetical protein